MTLVEPGTVWADNFPGNRGRTVRVIAVNERYAHCEVLTIRAASQQYLDRRGADLPPRERAAFDVHGRRTRILLTAFRPGPARTGYSPVATEVTR